MRSNMTLEVNVPSEPQDQDTNPTSIDLIVVPARTVAVAPTEINRS